MFFVAVNVPIRNMTVFHIRYLISWEYLISKTWNRFGNVRCNHHRVMNIKCKLMKIKEHWLLYVLFNETATWLVTPWMAASKVHFIWQVINFLINLFSFILTDRCKVAWNAHAHRQHLPFSPIPWQPAHICIFKCVRSNQMQNNRRQLFERTWRKKANLQFM